MGCRLWGRTEADTTERLPFHFSLSYIREGNGNPLEYSCLENPVDRGTWKATVHRITESDTTEALEHARILTDMYTYTYTYIYTYTWDCSGHMRE